MFVLHVVGAPVQAYYSLGGVSLVLAVAVSYRTTINRLLHDRLCVFLGVLQEAVPATFKETILHQMSSCGMGDISEALEQRFGELPAREEVLARLGGAILIWDVDVDIARAV